MTWKHLCFGIKVYDIKKRSVQSSYFGLSRLSVHAVSKFHVVINADPNVHTNIPNLDGAMRFIIKRSVLFARRLRYTMAPKLEIDARQKYLPFRTAMLKTNTAGICLKGSNNPV